MKQLIISILIISELIVLKGDAQNKLNTLFNAPNCIKYAYLNLGITKAKVIEDYGKKYKLLDNGESRGFSYVNNSVKGMNPAIETFIFPIDNNHCSGIALYFNFKQFDQVVNYMNSNFESKEPPAGVEVSFLKAWMQSRNNHVYLWKLMKTESLFYLTMR